MTIDAIIMLLGLFVALTPFLGFPASWDNVLLPIAGSVIVFLGIIVRRRGLIPRLRPPRRTSAYVESVPRPEGAHEGI